MGSLKERVLQQNQAIIATEINANFDLMKGALQQDKATAITIIQSYLSKYEVIDELRKAIKDKITTPPVEIRPLLDVNKNIADILNEGNYTMLEDYVNNLTPELFEPPLPPSFTSVTNIKVSLFPNKPSQDPRRTGRLVVPGPIDILKSIEVQKWMINNSMLYGFVLYGDKALYYVGVDKIKNQVNSASNKQEELRKIVSQFLKSKELSSLLTTPVDTVLNNKLPNTSTFTDPGNLEEIPSHSAKDNNQNVPQLVVVDGQPVVKTPAIAYLAMQEEALKAGIKLRISSGFRPAFGPNFTGLTSKGRNITFTTQETLRRDKSRWIASERAKFASDEEFIFKAKASAMNPATAPPGSSNHGSGIAIDLNTGGRTNFQPLKSEIYVWLIKNSYKFGFIRTVGSEEWHYEYMPELAKKGPYAKIKGTNDNKFYTDLGLAEGQFTI